MRDRQYFIDAAEGYFAAVDAKRLDDTLAYFNKDAVFTVQSGFVSYEGCDTGIREMYERFFESYNVGQHLDFEHIVDPVAEACTSRFRVKLEDLSGNRDTKRSVNQWFFRDGRFQRVFVWISGDNVLR